MSDIRKWFMKQHDKSTNAAVPTTKDNAPEKGPSSTRQNSVDLAQESTVRRKTSKYFATNNQNQKDEAEVVELPAKRKVQKDSGDLSRDVNSPPPKKLHKDDDEDFVCLNSRKAPVEVTPSKKLKSGSSRGVAQKPLDIDDSDEDEIDNNDSKSNLKSAGRGRGVRSKSAARGGGRAMEIDSDEENADDKNAKALKSNGRGRGGRGATTVAAGGRGRGGGGRGGFMNFGERKDPPHKGEKEVPEGAPDCLSGLTFVISGTLDSLEREEAEDLIKRHGGRITGSVSKKTNYLLCDEDIGGRKSSKAKELGTGILTEDGLFDMIRASSRSKHTTKQDHEKSPEKKAASLLKESPQKSGMKKDIVRKASAEGIASKGPTPVLSPVKQKVASPAKQKGQLGQRAWLPWTEKHKPKVPSDIVGNQAKVKQLEEWLKLWNDQFLGKSNKGKAKKQNDAGAKKAVLLSGTPGIGKTTSAKLISQMLGFQTIEVNASDSRGKADAKVDKGIGGSTSNSVKELVSNQALSENMVRSPKHPKVVLIMDEVDGMSAGDRGGVADLIASIKISKIPIICICNDRYSQKLKSLMNYCLQINFQKPTKTQMAKRLSQIANAEGLEVNAVALEELAERVNGDMRMALNQLQYMSLSMSVIKYDDIRQRLISSSKDEDISPFTAVDKLFGFNAGKLRMDERIDLSMSDPDLVPLLIQENYMNYRPSSAGKDDNGLKRMMLIARAADSIADGDIINVQIRRYRQWQLSQSSVLTSCIIPAALLHGQREVLEQGERNFNRFGGWLGKNSTTGKNYRLLEDLHVHLLASRESNLGRTTLRTDYLSLLLKHLTDPLKMLPKDEAVEKVVEFMDSYSISQEDFDSIVDLSKFQGFPNPLDGVQPAVKAALTKAYNKGSKARVIRVADLITLPGIKKAPKKRIAAMLEPVDDGLVEEKGDELAENEEENTSDTDDLADGKKNAQLNLQSLNSKGVVVQMDLKGGGTSAKKAPAGRGRGGGRGSGAAAAPKRKR